jgi:uncharacterized protein YqgC (DUF456 family)
MIITIIVGIVSGLLILAGAAGTLLPLLPGPPLSFVGLLIYAWYTYFDVITWPWLVAWGILTLLTFGLDFLGPALGAKKYKSSRLGIWGAILGGFIGTFVLGPIGLIAGPLLGGFLGEYLAMRDHVQAFKAAWGAFVGMMVGNAIKALVILSMFVYFIIAIIIHG